MKNRILLLMLVSSQWLFAQEQDQNTIAANENTIEAAPRYAKVSEFLLQFGVDNNKYKSLNRLLSDYQMPGTFNAFAPVAGLGWGINTQTAKLEFYATASHQKAYYADKRMDAFNFSLQQLFHYTFRSRSSIRISIYSGMVIQSLRLRIDSLVNPSQVVSFNSVFIVKEFGYVPIGIQLMNYKPRPATPDVSTANKGRGIGLRLAYYIAVLERDLVFAQYYVPYWIQHPNYFELTLTVGFYK